MGLEYSANEPLSAQEVADLFVASGINRPAGDLDRVGRMVRHANFTLSVRDGSRLVGIARSLTDFSYCCYLSDLAVDRAYQRRGIGRELVRRLGEALGDEVMILLIAAPAAMKYYPRIGFERVDNGWKISRRR